MDSIAAALLLYAVFPLWVAAGFADWACHRATRIEHTAGVRESVLHWVLFAQIGVGILAAAFLETNALVLAVAGGAFIAHELTVWGELRFVVGRREVRPIEQMVHSFMEILPLVSLALLA